MRDSTPHELLQAYFAETANEEQVAALSRWIEASAEHAEIVHSIVWLDSALKQQLHNDSLDSLSPEERAFVDRIDPEAWELVLNSALSQKRDTEVSAIPADDQDTDELPPIGFRELCSLACYLAMNGLRAKAGAIGSVAAMLVVGLVLYFVWAGPDSDSLESASNTTIAEPETETLKAVATLVSERGAAWDRLPGDAFYAGDRFNLVQGSAEIATHSGAVAMIQAPATIEFIDSLNALKLHSGRLVAVCETPASKGFLVRTPHMDVVDLGTRFGVDAIEPDASEVHVFSGSVRVDSQGSTGALPDSRTLLAGAATRVKSGTAGFVPVPINQSRFAFGLPATPGTSVVADHFEAVDPSVPARFVMDGGIGWDGPWQISSRNMSVALGSRADQPLEGGAGRYLDAVFRSGGSLSNASVVRRFGQLDSIDRAKPHRVRFLLRVDDSFVASEPFIQRLAVFDNPGIMQGTSGTDSWMITAFGFPRGITQEGLGVGELVVDPWSWAFYDGQADADETTPANYQRFKDTGIRLVPGGTYEIQITVWPQRSSWDLVIEHGKYRYDSLESLGRSIRFRADATQVGGHLHFLMLNYRPDAESRVQIDELSIEPIPTATTTW